MCLNPLHVYASAARTSTACRHSLFLLILCVRVQQCSRMVGKQKGQKTVVKGKRAAEKEWQEALDAAEDGDRLTTSARNVVEKQGKNGNRLSDEEYAAKIAMMKAGGKKGSSKGNITTKSAAELEMEARMAKLETAAQVDGSSGSSLEERLAALEIEVLGDESTDDSSLIERITYLEECIEVE